MKVIYDISICGFAQRSSLSATGVFRVADDLARALIHSGKCSLHFSATEMEAHYQAIKYFENTSEFQNACFPHSSWRYQFFQQWTKVNQRVHGAKGFSKAGWRAARKLLHHFTYPTGLKWIPEKGLDWADVFHSPFYAIPAQVRSRKHLPAFITIYDLIPILFPELYENDFRNQPHPVDNLQESDWVTCISQKTKEDLCNYRKDIDPRRIFVTPLAASGWFYPCRNPVAIDAVRSKYKIPAGQYILSLCTLEPRKNLAHLIRCFSKLVQQEQLKDLKLVLAGALGWKYESIFAELTGADSAIRDRIIIAGRVADEDMAALYSGAIAFVYPSLYEGFGLPPLEAMQCGTPVITSNTSSLPEVIGNAGIMVDPHDTDDLCQAMLQLVVKNDLRETMSRKSLNRAKLFSWDRCAHQTLTAYETAMDSKT